MASAASTGATSSAASSHERSIERPQRASKRRPSVASKVASASIGTTATTRPLRIELRETGSAFGAADAGISSPFRGQKLTPGLAGALLAGDGPGGIERHVLARARAQLEIRK